MTVGVLNPHQRHSLSFSQASAACVMVAGMMVLTGWHLDAPELKSAVPGLSAMNPATALVFFVAGVALLLLHRGENAPTHRGAVRWSAAAVIAVPLLCLSRLYLPWDFAPDRWLVAGGVAVVPGAFANRMAPMTAIDFVLLGATLVLLTWNSDRARRLASICGTIAGLIALMVIVDYSYQSRSVSTVGGLIPMAFNTAVGLLILSGGVLTARPADGVMRLFVSPGPGGVLARRLLPAAVLIPLTVGWLELQAQGRGWFNSSGGAAIMAISATLILACLIWLSAITLNRSDHARTRAEAELRDLNQHLEFRVMERMQELERVNGDLNAEVRARQRVEEDLRRTAEELRGWFEASPLAICSVTPDGTVTSWNRAAEALFGWSAAEVVGNPAPFIPRDMRAEATRLSRQVLAGKPFTNFESQRLCKDGHRQDVSISTAALRDADGAVCGIVAVFADIGDRKSLESQLRQSQKMEAIGRLAGGLAHDFNNILTVMQAAAEFLLDDLDADDPRRADALEIANAAQRAAKLTRQLLAFSRRQVLELQVLDLNAVVEPLEPMLRRLLETNIDLAVHLGDHLDAIKADPNQLDQVILNLVVNARDAMPAGGTILIETANMTLDEEYSRGHLSAHVGPHVVLSVTDIGVGMDAETQSRIFEPFFTTKPAGEGTGLGLATVYGIVKQSGGHISVYSEVGRGTTFKLYFPRFVGVGEAAAAVVPVEAGTATVGARIMLVEDDVAVRIALRRLLERHGYVVTDVPNAAAALERLAAATDSVDLVLSDMMMPGITGLELRRRLRATNSAVPVLLMSGYSEQAIPRMDQGESLAPHIEKPFAVDRLVTKIEELLG